MLVLSILHRTCKSRLIILKVQHLSSLNENRTDDVNVNPKHILYGDEASPPVRFVMMTASLLGTDLDFYKIDLFQGENKTDFYTKINPLRKVPVLQVANKVICDSHAIALYLCRSSDCNTLYPENINGRVKVDEMLYFNSGSLFPLDSAIFSKYFAGKGPPQKEQIDKWNFLLDYMEVVLTKHPWLGGENMTLCDLACAATVSSLRLLLPPLERHEKVNLWMKNFTSLQCYKINVKGLYRLNDFVTKMKEFYLAKSV